MLGLSQEITLSIVLPTFNNLGHLQRHLPPLIAYLEKLGASFEILICDDGSGDPVPIEKIAEELGCRYLRLDRNRGKGAAVRTGMLQARGEFRLFTDNDIPFEFESIGHFLAYLQEKDFDVICGDRTLSGSTYFHEVSLLRRMGSHFFAFLIGRFVAGGWLDTQCGIKAFRAAAARDLFGCSRINRFAFDVELLHIALKRNYDIKRLPVRLRVNEPSQIHVVRDGLSMLRDLARVLWYGLRGRYAPRGPVDCGFTRFLARSDRTHGTEEKPSIAAG